ALADLQYPVEEQEGRRVRKAGKGSPHLAHQAASSRSGRHTPPLARPSTSTLPTGAGRAAPVTTSRPRTWAAGQSATGGTTPSRMASAAAATASAPPAPKRPMA